MQCSWCLSLSDSKKDIKYTSNWGFEPWGSANPNIEMIPDTKTRFYIEVERVIIEKFFRP